MKQGACTALPVFTLKAPKWKLHSMVVAVEGAVGEVGDAVGAARLGGVEGAVDIVDGDEFLADLEADDAVCRHVGGGADLGFGHELSRSSLAGTGPVL